jgi:hypothetical protein
MLLRHRAQRLLTEIRALQVNHSTWADAQALMSRWGASAAQSGNCTAEACDFRINLVQTLPPIFVGYPDSPNRLARVVDHLGLRSAAVRGGFTMHSGFVDMKWFGEQVSLPVRDWYLRSGEYVPEIAVSTAESSTFVGYEGEASPEHPYRRVRNMKGRYGLLFHFKPQESAAEQASLMDFRFTCITRFRPCESEHDILPEDVLISDAQKPAPPTR